MSLGFAFYQVYKKNKIENCDNCEPIKATIFKSKFYLWLVLVFVVLMTFVSYYPQLLHNTANNKIILIDNSNTQTIKLNIEGMVCSGCEESISHSISKIDGVVQVNTSHSEGTSIIEFDTTKTNRNAIKEVIQSKGYIIKSSTNE